MHIGTKPRAIEGTSKNFLDNFNFMTKTPLKFININIGINIACNTYTIV